MDFSDFETGINDQGRRIDKVIRKFLPELSLSNVYSLIRKGLIKVNQKKINQNYKIQENDIVNIPLFIIDEQKNSKITEKTSTESEKIQNLPPIVFENEHILILNKPYDMLVHGGKDSLDVLVKNYYRQTHADTSLSFTPGPLHRIDRKTTGLICFSMSIQGANWFTQNIKNHEIQKKYYGIIQGKLNTEEIWQDFITKNDEDSKNFHTVKASKNAGENEKSAYAYTKVCPVKYGFFKNQEITIAVFDIKTGRTHQIRSQCALHSHPLLGDTAYGGAKTNGKYSHFLQAFSLSFPQNPLGLPQLIEIPLNSEISRTFSHDFLTI